MSLNDYEVLGIFLQFALHQSYHIRITHSIDSRLVFKRCQAVNKFHCRALTSFGFKMNLGFGAVVITALAVICVTSEKARFDNYRVYRVDVQNKLQLNVLRELSETSDSVNEILCQ